MVEVNIEYDDTIDVVVQVRVSGSNSHIIHETKPRWHVLATMMPRWSDHDECPFQRIFWVHDFVNGFTYCS